MCGRYTLTASPRVLEARFELSHVPGDLKPRFNIAPGQKVAVVADETPRELAMFRWGLVPSWAKDFSVGDRMINARAETVAEKPAFRAAFRDRRCLVLADGFYEWKREGKQKLPTYIRMRSGEPFAFAGLWESWRTTEGKEIRSCTIITTEPNELLATIHNRMPVILAIEDCATWLSRQPNSSPKLKGLLKPFSGEALEAYAVSRLVNSPSNDRAECIRPA
jgi:putative SOS response-associated peptidase YedK